MPAARSAQSGLQQIHRHIRRDGLQIEAHVVIRIKLHQEPIRIAQQHGPSMRVADVHFDRDTCRSCTFDRVGELVQGMIVQSGNDATIALA